MPRPLSHGVPRAALTLVALLHAALAAGAAPAPAAAQAVAPMRWEPTERLPLGRAELGASVQPGLGVVVRVRGLRGPDVLLLPVRETAGWTILASRWLDSTRDAVVEGGRPLRSPAVRGGDRAMFFQRELVDGQGALALYATTPDDSGGVVLEVTDAEARQALTMFWGLVSEADTAPVAFEVVRGDTVRPPYRLTRQVRPVKRGRWASPLYPYELRAASVSGTAVLTCVVDSAGRVDRATIETVVATHREFARSAAEWLRTARFEPGEADGRRVSARVVMPFTFVIGGGAQVGRFEVVRIRDRTPG